MWHGDTSPLDTLLLLDILQYLLDTLQYLLDNLH
tara:strand:+ start:280 stop:381 length:102 start_codon:yes stop_codon:yes gene_type:complete